MSLQTRVERLRQHQVERERERNIPRAPVNVATGVFKNVYLAKSSQFYAHCPISGVVENYSDDKGSLTATTELCSMVIPLALVLWKPRGKVMRMLLDARKDRTPSKMEQLREEGRPIYLDEVADGGQQREDASITVYPTKFKNRTLAFSVCNFTYRPRKSGSSEEYYLFVVGLPTGELISANDNAYGRVVNFFAQALEVELSDQTRYNHTDMFSFRRISDCMLGFTVPASPPKTSMVLRVLEQLGLTKATVSTTRWLEIVHEHLLSSTLAALDVVRELVARKGGCYMFTDVSLMFDHVFRVMAGEKLPRLLYQFDQRGGNTPTFVASKDFGTTTSSRAIVFPGLSLNKTESVAILPQKFSEFPRE